MRIPAAVKRKKASWVTMITSERDGFAIDAEVVLHSLRQHSLRQHSRTQRSQVVMFASEVSRMKRQALNRRKRSYRGELQAVGTWAQQYVRPNL